MSTGGVLPNNIGLLPHYMVKDFVAFSASCLTGSQVSKVIRFFTIIRFAPLASQRRALGCEPFSVMCERCSPKCRPRWNYGSTMFVPFD